MIYRVFTANTPEELEGMINHEVEEGGTVYGSVSVCRYVKEYIDEYGDSVIGTYTIYAQSMWCRES